jgi:hypothetical protein
VLLDALVSDLGVTRRIASAIAHSLDKAERLHVEWDEEPVIWQVREIEKWDVAARGFVVDESGATCGCRKQETCGIPCSHLRAILKRKNQPANLSGMIARQWMIEEGQRREPRLQIASKVKALELPPAL